MFEIIKSGGWTMLPLIACSVAAGAIVAERFWALRRQHVCPRKLVDQIWQWTKQGNMDVARITALKIGSPLGRILVTAWINRNYSREIIKESIEEVGRHVVLELERYLNTLGTIASISPLLGLLGTVSGMIETFNVISNVGAGNAHQLAGGIAKALVTTVGGLIVAIPSLMFYRHFQRRIDVLVVYMEGEALKMIEIVHGEREWDVTEG